MERSLLAIKLLANGRTGAIAAAGTTSLPEVLDGERNYDYRFGWVRDLCFTLDALLAVGMQELLQASVTWLLGATTHTHPRVDPVYELDGRVLRTQQRLALPGYIDCGMLLAARRGFGDVQGQRINGTIDAIRSELHAGGPLFYRYSGMRDQENAFLACSFWMVEAMAIAGRLDEAADVMEGAVGLASDVGLYTEEMEPGSLTMRGNLPQALTHLSLISAADALSRCDSDARPRAGQRADAPRSSRARRPTARSIG